MSDETVGGVLRHKDTRNIQVRLDYMLLYRNETKAKVIRIMETWTAQKKAEWYKQSVEAKEQKLEPPEEELWVTMSYEQFSLFAYGTMKHDNIKQNVDDLVKEKHLQRRPHPTIPYGPPQYLLNLKLLQKMLDEQEIPSLVDDIGKIAPPRKKHTPLEKYPQGRGINHRGDPGKIPPGTGENSYPSNNTTENTNNHTENKDDMSLSLESDAPAATIHDIEIARQRKTDPRIAAVSSHSQADIGNDDVPTVKLPAIPKQMPAPGAAIPPSSDTGAQAPSLNDTYSTPAQRSGASLAGIPASPGAVQARQVIPKRPLRKVIEKPQLTFGGQQVREWYEQARECKVRMTDKNVVTLNRLADIDEMTQENLRDVLELYDTDKWLIEHNVTVDLQELEKQDGKFTFERGLLAVKRKRRAKGPATNISKNGTDLNQYGLQALLQRQEQKAV